MKISPEFLPIVEWWEKDGKQIVAGIAIAAVAWGGWHAWNAHQASVKVAAGEALVNAITTAEMEEAVSRFSGQAVGGALRLRLAKSYFDDARYEEALAVYEGLVGKAPEGFEDIPVVGKAQCLEAMGKFDEAAKAFDAFAEEKKDNYLTLTAQLGAARAYAQAGDKKKALARLDALKSAVKGDEISKARIDATIEVVKRYEKPVAKPVVKPAEKPVVKPAEKPAEKPAAKK